MSGALHPDRLFPADPTTRAIARELYAEIGSLPIISPHGHMDPAWFADNENFQNPAELLLTSDHYLFRMLYSQGIPLEKIGIQRLDGSNREAADPREIWRVFAENYHLFLGTPSRLWHDWVYTEIFGLTEILGPKTADLFYDVIEENLALERFRPRALFEQFNIEVVATTEDPLDPLLHHKKLGEDGWGKKVITAFRPDNVLDPEYDGFIENVQKLGEITGFDTATYSGYLDALRNRRAFFKAHGATSTDHGHPTALTADLSRMEAEDLFARVTASNCSAADAELFRGHMLMQMAEMSLDDGLVMQLHPGCFRSHNRHIFDRFGRDMGGDIPMRTDYVRALHPLLNKYGNEPDLTFIVFTLDETTYSRELAPLAGHYPCLKLGPAWWFHDSPEGMRRFREQVTETAGFYNTVGFNDDTRAFLSVPARHDLARRIDCSFLARMVAEHRMTNSDAHKVARDLTYNLAKAAYKL